MEWRSLSSSVRLRPARLSDAVAMARWRNRSWVRRGYFYRRRITGAAQRRWLAGVLMRPDVKLWVIEYPARRPVGTIALYHIDRASRTAEYGWVMIGEREALGQGVAREATRLVLRYAFRNLRLHRVELIVRPGNPAALRLYRSAGFRAEGRLRGARWTGRAWEDALLMAVLEHEARLA